MNRADSDWFADDDFWADSYGFMFTPERFQEAQDQVERIIALSGCAAGALLDLACGPGRHAVPFARRGFRVTAVDRTRFLLDKATAYAEEAGVEVEWVERDMRQFTRSDAFDLAISMFTSFGFFDEHADNTAVLRNVYRSLVPGGAFVIDMMGKELLAGRFQPTTASELADGRLMIQRREVIDAWSRLENEWLFIDGGRARSYRFRHWVYSGHELRLLLESVGFIEVDILGSLDGTAYGVDASRLIGVARKAS